MAQPLKTPVAIIIGAGDATGGAIATRFALEGLTVVATRRQREVTRKIKSVRLTR